MIIEDDVFICKELMQFFENNGYSTQTLDTNNCDVLQVIQESTPDLILLDINLPNIDGFLYVDRLGIVLLYLLFLLQQEIVQLMN